MADTDTIDVTFNKQKVYHDGTSMIVAKAGDKLPVEQRLIAGFVAEGAINAPKGWVEEAAEKDEVAVADGTVQVAPSADGGDIAALRAEYREALGKAAFNGWDAAELRKRIDAQDGAPPA